MKQALIKMTIQAAVSGQIDNATAITVGHLLQMMDDDAPQEVDILLNQIEFPNISFHRIPEDFFTVRTKNCLTKHGMTYLGQVMFADKRALMKIPHLGKRSCTEVLEVMKNYGLSSFIEQFARDELPLVRKQWDSQLPIKEAA